MISFFFLLLLPFSFAVSDQPRQIFLESLLNGTSPIIPIQSTPSQGANGSISSPGVPRIIPSNSGRVQVGTTLLVLPANGSAFNFVNKTGSSIVPVNG